MDDLLSKAIRNQSGKFLFGAMCFMSAFLACQQKKSEDLGTGAPVSFQGAKTPTPFQTHAKIDTLFPVQEHLQTLLKNGETPIEILVILDVDGTLTNYSHPEKLEFVPLRPRKGVSELLRYLEAHKISFLISSAWSPPSDTQKRVILVEKSVFPTGPSVLSQGCIKPTLTTENFLKNATHTVYRCGKSISVKASDCTDSRFFRGKAFVPLYGLPPDLQKKIKRVIFVDDSLGNHSSYFIHDYAALRQHPSFTQLPENYDFFQPQPLDTGSEIGEEAQDKALQAQLNAEDTKDRLALQQAVFKQQRVAKERDLKAQLGPSGVRQYEEFFEKLFERRKVDSYEQGKLIALNRSAVETKFLFRVKLWQQDEKDRIALLKAFLKKQGIRVMFKNTGDLWATVKKKWGDDNVASKFNDIVRPALLARQEASEGQSPQKVLPLDQESLLKQLEDDATQWEPPEDDID